MTRLRSLFVSFFTLGLVFAASASAATTDFRVLLDTDNNAATGCNVSGMSGVEQLLLTRVETTTTGAVTRTSRQVCTNGVLSAETDVNTSGWPAGFQPSSGNLLVESRMAISAIGAQLPSEMHIGIEAQQGSAIHAATARPDGSPALFPEMPRSRRRAAGPSGPARTITMDGDGSDWAALTPVIGGVAAGGSAGLRIINFYAFAGTDGFLYFRFDANLSTDAPVAIKDDYTRPAGAGLTVPAPGVLGNDLEPNGNPLTASPVSQPAHGDLTLNADGSFTYTPDDPASTQKDGFEYKASNGTKESNAARVDIEVGVAGNVAPIFASTANPNVFEGTTNVVTLVAPDPDGDTVTFSITGGADQSRFSLTGGNTLVFNSAPDFEAPLSTLGTNVYAVQVTADDAHGHTTVQSLTVTVQNVEEVPAFNPPFSFSVTEGSTAVGTVTAVDPDGSSITYSIAGGDAARFTINPTTGAISFVAAPDFEAPTDLGTNNVYTFQVTATDGGGSGVVQTINVTVTDVDEVPVFTSTATPSVAENNLAVLTVAVSDPEGDTITYSLSGGVDAAKFAINATTGALSFLAAPNFEAPGDADANNVYLVQVTATDGANPVTQNLAVTVTNVNEAPSITSANNATVPENTTAVLTVTTTDPESNAIAYSVTGGADAARFAINATTGVLTFVAAPNFEVPTDAGANNVYDVIVTATDGVNPVTQTISVTVTDVNEAPAFTSTATPSVPENTTAVLTVAATDPEAQAVTYALTGGADLAKFAINATTGALTFLAAPNFEAPTDADANNTYIVQVTATDGTNSTPVTITVTVTNANEAPVANDATFAVNENSANGAAVGTVSASDPDNGQTLTYAITAGNTSGAFAINATSGAITVANAAAIDFEVNPSFTLTVTVTDSGTGALTDTAAITVNVTNLNEAPVVNAATVPLAENSPNGTAVHTVTFTEPDNTAQTHTFAITAGNTLGAFAINSTTGAITVADVTKIDFEANPTFTLTVQVTDGGAPTPSLSGTATITINLTDVNEAPAVTSPNSANVAENTTAVLTVTSSDPENNSVTYSITGGADAAKFSINAATGALAFLAAPNFEAPTDADTNNTYLVQVTANDGTNNTNQTITVTVTDVNEAPSITSGATASVAENTTAVTTVTTTDPEGNTVTYSITGGADAAKFSINASTGALAFLAAPDFEAPADADTNNQYVVQVTANDGTSNTNQTITVTVTDVNEAPSFTSTATPTVPENTTAVTTVATSDPEGNTVTYSITGGADQALFSINNTTGALSFLSAPNFEAPADAGANNVYDVQVTANDGTNTTNQAIAVTVTNANEAPSITSGNTANVAENTTAVATVTTTDPEGDTITFSISGGADAAKFSINATTGALSFSVAPNFEAPTDADTNNVYLVQVTANDGTNNTNQTISVTVTDVNEAPSITSANSANVAENTTAVLTVTSSDPESNSITYSITGGADAAKFSINSSTGVLAFLAAPDFEAPTDADANNVYLVQVTANDGTNNTNQTISVTVTNGNETPVITSGNTANVAENTTAVTTVTTTDPEGDTITFSISGGADAAKFAINATTGALSFLVAPNFEAPTDGDANNVYLVQVTATDGTTPVNQTITVTVTNVDEQPLFSSSASPSVPENTTAVVTVAATDPEGATPTYSITGGADQAKFTINSTTGALSFLVGPDFEVPTDADANNTYIVQVTASDANPATQTITVTVTDANDPPAFTSTATPSVAENVTAVVTVVAADPEAGTVTYSITGGADQAKFAINSSTGALSFLVAPDFEAPTDADANNIYLVQVTATDGTNPAVQNLTVTVTNVNEAPSITSGNTANVAENTTAVVTVTSTDPESQTITYSLTGGADQAKFSINSSTGVLTFLSAPNFEVPTDADANNVYIVQVTATDGTNPVNQTISVTVTNVDEGPSFTSGATPSVPENTTAVTTVAATDPEGTAVTYSITGGADQAKFSINNATGALAFLVAPNFEAPTDADTNNIYLVQVTATDGANPIVQNLTVTVTNVNEAPSFTSSATPTLAENSVAVVTVAATDPDGTTPTYSITGGADAARFAINGTTGALTFLVAPNFEAPTDADTNNVYLVDVTATDGTNPVVQSLTVTITDVNEAPTFSTGNTANVDENTTAVATVSATDPEGVAVTYSLTGGADQAKFTINSTTGALVFASAPNFETPTDADANNTYIVQVTATDGVNPANLTITVTVVNVNEAPVNTVPGAQTTNEDTNVTFPGTISVSDPDGNVTVQVTLTATKGTLSTNGTTGLTFTTGDGTDDTTLVFTGTTTNINARLNGLVYKPDANYYSNDVADANGPGSITILTNDQGNTGSGGAKSSNNGTPDSITVDINAVNDKPTTASYTVANGNAHVTHSGLGITISASDSNELKEDSGDVDAHDPYSELTVQIVAGSLSPANATLTLLDPSTGAFYFEPPGGLSGTGAASFQYMVCDDGYATLGLASQCSDPATVQFTITGNDTWFIDDSATCAAACNGSSTKPLVGLNNAALSGRGTGDRVFAYSGTYNHGFTMAASELLVGQASSGSFDSLFGVAVPSNGTLDARPALSGAAVTLQNTLTAANNTVVRGLTLTTGANKGYVSASGNTTLTVLETSVNSTGNMAIDVTGATNAATNVAFTSTTSSGGTRGISLDGVNGSWSLGSGALNNNTQAAFYLQNSNASTITYAGNFVPTGSGRAVLIGTADGNSGSNSSNGLESGTTVTLSGNITAGGIAVYESSGGTLNLTGTTHTWSTGATRGVDLIDNNGATINFSGGNLTITTTSGTGFHASQGGTVNVTGATNTISTSAGIGFEVNGTAPEHFGGGFAWKSISSTNGTRGVSATFIDGPFSISGDGADGDTLPDSVTAGGTITGSDQRGIEIIDVNGPVSLGGITITNPADTAGPDASVAAGTCGNIPSGGSNTGCYAGIHLDTTATVTLRTINVSGSGSIGINGNAINGLTIDTVNVSNSGNTSGEDGMRLYNLNGSGSITALVVTNSFGKGLLIENTNVALASAGSPYIVSNSNFQNSSNAQGVNLNTDLTGTMHVKFTNGTISGNFSNGIQTAGLGSGTLGIYVDNTSFSNNTSAVVVQSSGGTTNFDIRNIDHVGRTTNASCGMCIKSDGAGVATGVIESNLIGNGTVGSGASCGGGCNGINIDARNTSSMTVAVRGNTIRNVDQNGIGVRGGEGTSKLNVTLTGNLIKDPDNAASTLAAIFADSGVLSSDGNCVTVTIGGNTAWPGSPTTSTSGVQNRIEGAWGVSGVRVRKLFGGGAPPEPVFNLPGYDGSGVVNWIQARNSFTGVATPVTQNTGSGGAFTGGASCP